MSITRPRGVNDLLPETTAKWREVEALLHLMAEEYGFGEIRTPIFEQTMLFARGVGETTDIVQKEMYTFNDRSDRSLTLRPENTAAVCRAYLENKLYGQAANHKLYYLGPMFRYERPQAGRFRQFHQFGLEILGTKSPLADAEIIAFACDFFRRIGVDDLKVHLNSVGCPNCRSAYRSLLQDFLQPNLDALCGDCQNRYERNPLRILDCKKEACALHYQGAPKISDHLCAECAEHFEQVQQLLAAAGLKYVLDTGLVRGLDYYTKTAFEIRSEAIGAQSALCGGGRYDGLMAEIGDKDIPGIGYAMGIERVFQVLAAVNQDIEIDNHPDAYIISIDQPEAQKSAFALANDLRKAGLKTELNFEAKSIKAQLKAANNAKAAWAIIIAENELAYGKATLKNMANSEQLELPFGEIRAFLFGA